jgi:hypothetical protein
VISSSQSLYLNTGQHKHKINAYTHQTSMHCVEFEPRSRLPSELPLGYRDWLCRNTWKKR